RARRPDLEQAALARIKAISDPADVADPDYVDGLRAALASALDYGLAAIEHGEDRAPPPPAPLLSQARLAARNGVGLDTVLRRYVAGYTLLGDCLVDEAGGQDPGQGAPGFHKPWANWGLPGPDQAHSEAQIPSPRPPALLLQRRLSRPRDAPRTSFPLAYAEFFFAGRKPMGATVPKACGVRE